MDNCSKNGLSLMYPNYYNTLSYNTISNCSDNGIALGGSNHSTLFSNLISQCSDNGIYLSDSNHNTLSSNMIYNCSIIGIHLASYNHYNTLSSNMISNCSNDGIYLYSLSEDNILSYNTISHCSDNGIELAASDYNTLSYNTISNCSDNGIELAASDYNSLSYNTIYNNSNYGFYFGPQDFSNENMANWNNFLDNNVGGTSQAYDTGTANNIGYNHWDEWLSPDIEPDGIVDLPYSIDGDAINTDPSPLTTPKPPLVNIVTPFDQGYSTDTITVILSGNAIQYWYYIEGEDTENQTWRAMEERTLNDGTYTLHAYGKILNTISLVSVVFTIDTTPPTFNIVSPTSITYTMGTIIVDLSGDTDVAYYWYFIEGFSVDNKLWTQNIDETLDDGAYILHAYANDTTGNTAYVSVAFKIDTVAPTITLESPPHDTVHNSWTIIKVDVVDVFLDTVLYNWDGITNKTWNQDYEYWTLLPSEETQHNLYVYANDRLGRWTSEVFVFTTDDTNPVVDITSPTEITYNQNSVTLTYTVSEGIATIYINGVANTTALPSGVIIPNLQDGIYNITIMAVDSAGNIGNVTVIFVIDTAEEISSETTAETSSEPTSETTTTPQVGFFPGLLPVLLFYIIIVVFLRRHKYNS
ncbi:MAG: right-handed parallel beta-helix repeat-containing protein [Candidatus Hodarchaeota archaeon]